MRLNSVVASFSTSTGPSGGAARAARRVLFIARREARRRTAEVDGRDGVHPEALPAGRRVVRRRLPHAPRAKHAAGHVPAQEPRADELLRWSTIHSVTPPSRRLGRGGGKVCPFPPPPTLRYPAPRAPCRGLAAASAAAPPPLFVWPPSPQRGRHWRRPARPARRPCSVCALSRWMASSVASFAGSDAASFAA